MKKWLLIGALAFVGGVLAFAVHPSDSSVGPFDLKAVGGVLLATAALVAAGIGVAAGVKVCSKPGDNSPSKTESGGSLQLDGESLRTITGLVAVVVAIIAVAALTVVAINLLGGGKQSTVAITSSAFGIVSAVVSAYLGIKASVNASDKALAVVLGGQEADKDEAKKEEEEKERKKKEEEKKEERKPHPPHGGST